METTNSLSRAERLRGRNDISRLLAQGRRGSVSCLHYCCLRPNGAEADRIVVSVPKKLFKRAVKRNLLKRRIREAYRTQKSLLGATEGRRDILFIYNSPEVLPYAAIRAAVAEVLTRLADAPEAKPAAK